jgi:hypothetical protein
LGEDAEKVLGFGQTINGLIITEEAIIGVTITGRSV